MSELPAPLVPADCDLRDFQFMPVDVRRLLTSETWMLGSGDARSAAMCLWLESWHQVPAGSLPSNEAMLAHLAQANKWKKIQNHSLRGWILCADDRLYHPVVAEKALEAWLEKLAARFSGGEGNAKRWGASFDRRSLEQSAKQAVARLHALNPNSRTLQKKFAVALGCRSQPDSPPDWGPDSTPESGRQKKPIARDREETGKRQGRDICEERTRGGVNGSVVADPEGVLVDSLPYEQAIQATFPKGPNPTNWILALRHARRLVEMGKMTWPALVAVVERFAAFIAAGGVSDPRYIRAAHNFFDPDADYWAQDWAVPRTKAEVRQDANIEAARQWLAQSADES